MLNILRNIRKQLASENKVMVYLRYAIGEIFLVVIGILIALSINTWNQNRINNQLEHELLMNLSSDINADIKNLTYQDSLMTLAAFSKIRLIEFIGGAKIPNDSVLHYLSKTGPTTTFTPTKITYEEMKNSDAFKIISSKKLRREIAILYRQYDIVKDHEGVYFDSQSRLRNIRVEDFATASYSLISIGQIRDVNQVLNQIKTNRRFINALETNYNVTMSNQYKQALIKASNFKSIITNYLNQ